MKRQHFRTVNTAKRRLLCKCLFKSSFVDFIVIFYAFFRREKGLKSKLMQVRIKNDFYIEIKSNFGAILY